LKVALINGQNHKGSTYHIGRRLAEKLADNSEITDVFVPRDMPEFCTGCTACVIKDEKQCLHYKYMEPITRIIDSCDI
jgi:multimeric flavodoxin WrbA